MIGAWRALTWGMFVTFLALLGPQKVLLSFDRATRHQDARDCQRVAIAATCVAILVGGLRVDGPVAYRPAHPARHPPRGESLAPPRGA
jgi:hypothetical protein